METTDANNAPPRENAHDSDVSRNATDFQTHFDELRYEMRTELAGCRKEIEQTRSELKTELAGCRKKIEQTREEFRDFSREIIERVTIMSTSMNKHDEERSNRERDIALIKDRIRYNRENFVRSDNYENIMLIINPPHYRNQELSMLSTRELEQLYVTRASEDLSLSAKGGCVAAAKEACRFFRENRSLMNAEIISDAILVRYNNLPISFSDGDQPHPSSLRGEVCQGMRYFVWSRGPVWTQGNTPIAEDIGKFGQFHTVVLLHTSDGNVVVVDWSIGQFLQSELSQVRLYVTFPNNCRF
jgi:ElaB/YqjD/DUF883 family membrane-anchored ribosome-binding protein